MVVKTQPSQNFLFLIEESPEAGYEARALDQSIYTAADTIAELKFMIKDALQCHFDKKDRPKIIRLHYGKEEIMAAWDYQEIYPLLSTGENQLQP